MVNIVRDPALWNEFLTEHYPDSDCGHCSCGWVEYGDARDRVDVMDHFREMLLKALDHD